MVRILYLVTSSGVGGTELALLDLCRRLDRQRFEPTVVSVKVAGATAARIRSLGIEVLSLAMDEKPGPGASVALLLAARRLPQLLAGRDFALVHSFLFRAHLLGRFVARRLGAGAVVNSYRSSVEGRGPGMHCADRWTRGRVTRFHLQSAALAANLQKRLGVPPERCVVIPNGIDLTAADRALAAARPAARAHLGLGPTGLGIAYVGRLHEEKGVGHLLAAFPALLQSHPSARLFLAGDGPARGALEGMATSLGLNPFVRFLGEVPSPWPLLAGADIFALPSLWEGMPNALLEAMAAGLPCVATAVGAVPEMAADGEEAMLVLPRDAAALSRALLALAAAPARRQEMGARARRRIEAQFRIEATVGRMERLYDELLAGAGGGR